MTLSLLQKMVRKTSHVFCVCVALYRSVRMRKTVTIKVFGEAVEQKFELIYTFETS